MLGFFHFSPFEKGDRFVDLLRSCGRLGRSTANRNVSLFHCDDRHLETV